jgi:hypothetical protein
MRDGGGGVEVVMDMSRLDSEPARLGLGSGPSRLGPF